VSHNLSLLGVVFRANGDGSLCRRGNALLCRRATGGGCRCRPGYLAGGQSALTYLCLTIYGYGFGIFATFYGTAAVVRGYLIPRSGYLPRGLGAILIFGGASFIAKNVLVVFAPQSDLPYVIVLMFLAMASLTLWLLIKGVDRARWDARWTGC
jgi:Domain of unknown function (DUF4386)